MNLTRKQFSYFVAFFLTILAYWAMLCSPLLYVDDAVRVYTYLTINQGVHGRPLADAVYMLLTGGLFVDFSPLSQIIAIGAMTWSGFLLYDTFFPDQAGGENDTSMARCCIVLVFTTFPLNFGIISYRFDSISLGLALFLATLAFIRAAKIEEIRLKSVWHFFIPGLLIAGSLALYQAMLGIYACCTVLYLINMLLQNKSFVDVAKKWLIFVFACLSGVVLYLPAYFHSQYMLQFDHYGLGPHPYVKGLNQLPNLADLPATLLKNIGQIFSTLKTFLDLNVPSVTLILVAIVFVGLVLTRKIGIGQKMLVLLALPCALAVCFSLQIFLAHPVLEPRTCAPVAAFAACLFAFTLNYMPSKKVQKGLLLLFSVCILSSAAILTTIGNAQRDQYKFETELVYNGIEADLMHLYMNEGLKSFYITPPEPPVCTTLQVLKQQYGFLESCGAMSATIFSIQKILAYLPINYFLPSLVLPEVDYGKLETVIEKYNYSIKKVEPGKFVIVMNNITVPPFKPERWK